MKDINLDHLEAKAEKLINGLVWAGVWVLYALGFVGVVIASMLKDPAGIALLLFVVAAVMIGYWCATGFPPPWRAM